MGKRDTCFGGWQGRSQGNSGLETGTRNCAGHSRFVFCVNTYQCVISFSSQYCKSKQGRRGREKVGGQELVGGSGVTGGDPKWFS